MFAHLSPLAIIPFAAIALVIVLIVRDRLARMSRRAPRPKRAKPKPSHLTVVPRSQMDDELQDLLKRR